MAVFNRLLFSQIKIIMFVWTIVTVFMFSTRLFIQSHAEFGFFCLTTIGLGFYAGILSSKTFFLYGRYLAILKLSAKNIKSFWLMLVVQNFVLITLNVSVGLVFAYSIKSYLPQDYMHSASEIFHLSLCICIFIILHLLMIALDCMQPFDGTSDTVFNKKTQVRQMLIIVVFGLIFFGLSYLYNEFSPLLAFALATLLLFEGIVFVNNQVVKTLHRQLKIKVAFGGAVLLLIVFSSIAAFEMQRVHASDFLWVREYKWSFSDIQKVTTIEDWILWQNKLNSQEVLTTDQLIEVYDKVSQYCPPKPRDNALSVKCEGLDGYRDYQYTSVSLRTEEDVLKLLSSSNEYAQIMGLMYARKLKKPLSRNIIIALEFIAEKESTIQGLARNTLSNSFPENYTDGIVFFTKKSTPSVE